MSHLSESENSQQSSSASSLQNTTTDTECCVYQNSILAAQNMYEPVQVQLVEQQEVSSLSQHKQLSFHQIKSQSFASPRSSETSLRETIVFYQNLLINLQNERVREQRERELEQNYQTELEKEIQYLNQMNRSLKEEMQLRLGDYEFGVGSGVSLAQSFRQKDSSYLKQSQRQTQQLRSSDGKRASVHWKEMSPEKQASRLQEMRSRYQDSGKAVGREDLSLSGLNQVK
ncbi:Hypothetical_protein [Hexamita inflata]|uniref:Hypothetical_protein n=1 Tax=Hexamita inflata TaxID=28002 RepID=A0AA86U1D6_9EUKA|nr:Hypothetical protein HINF_LOCUS1910 [Hexamita inflata]CAI9934707.1 Hypothetical protein HINF_LOCUS22352 [Hexamita inflata]